MALARLRWHRCLQEQPHARYVSSFKRQFIDQTVRLLRQQTARSLNALLPECVCLVAMLPGTQQILATCDIHPPEDAAGQHPKAVPPHDKHAAYVTNVAVDSKSRGQGLGFQLLEAAAAFALEEWQAQAVYTTVDSANKVGNLCHLYTIHTEIFSRVCQDRSLLLQAATNLYAKCGFEEAHSTQDSGGGTGETCQSQSG